MRITEGDIVKMSLIGLLKNPTVALIIVIVIIVGAWWSKK
jgi:hypothetical protein